MANPFITDSTESGPITINGVTADALSDVEITLSNIKDVLISLLADKQVLQYDEIEGKWKNVTLNVVTALSNLSDCTITTPTENQVLQYNGTNWVNATLSLLTTLSSLTDCTITSASTGQVLKYNGSKWVNASDADTLATLTDVSVSNPSNDQLLVFTTASSLNKWTPYTLSGATFDDTNKTITVSGTTALAGLTTDVTLTGLANGNLLMYSTSSNKWINTTSIPDNLFFLSDDGNNTRKMQFQLSAITAGQTRTEKKKYFYPVLMPLVCFHHGMSSESLF